MNRSNVEKNLALLCAIVILLKVNDFDVGFIVQRIFGSETVVDSFFLFYSSKDPPALYYLNKQTLQVLSRCFYLFPLRFRHRLCHVKQQKFDQLAFWV